MAQDLQNWKNKISTITHFVDFDIKNELTTNQKYFSDPYHLSEAGQKIFERQFQVGVEALGGE